MTLNADCLREISKFIHDPYDIARFSCVNRTCRDAMKHPAEIRIRVRHKHGLQHMCRWVHKNISHCHTLVVYGDCHLWSMFWRYLPVTIAPYLENIELVHDQEHKPLIIPSIEDVAPICENLQMLDVVALHSVHLGSGISRYSNVWSIDVTCPIITADWLTFAHGSYEYISLMGNVVMPEGLTSLQIPPLRFLRAPSTVISYCRELPYVVELHIRWDGMFLVDTLDAPCLKTVYLQGGEWDTSWIPAGVRCIYVENGTITPLKRNEFTICCTDTYIILERTCK